MPRTRKTKNYRRKMLENYSYTVEEVIDEDPEKCGFRFTVYYLGEEVGTSRVFRLRVQAEGKAEEFIKAKVDLYDETAITLDVQNLHIDSDTLFRRFE